MNNEDNFDNRKHLEIFNHFDSWQHHQEQCLRQLRACPLHERVAQIALRSSYLRSENTSSVSNQKAYRLRLHNHQTSGAVFARSPLQSPRRNAACFQDAKANWSSTRSPAAISFTTAVSQDGIIQHDLRGTHVPSVDASFSLQTL